MAEVSEIAVSGPLGPFVAGFVAELSRRGFQPVTVRKHVGLMTALSDWMAANGVAPSGLSAEILTAVVDAARRRDRAIQHLRAQVLTVSGGAQLGMSSWLRSSAR